MTVADEILDIINEEQGWTGGKHPRAPKGKKKKDKYKGGEFVPKDAGGVTAKAPPDALHPIYKLVQKIRKNAKPVYQHQVGDIITYKGQEHKVVDRDKKGDFVFLKQQIPRVRVGSVQDVHQTLTIKVPASDISTAVRAIPGQDTLGLKGTLGKPVQPDLPPEVAKNIIAPEPKNEPLETKLFVSGPITQKKEGVTPLGEDERGINPSLKVTIEGDGNGIWKPLRSSHDNNGVFEHEERLSKCPMGHREIMVSQIADILGPEFSDLVPKCVEKVMPNTANVFAGVRGSCMKWINNFESCSSFIKKEELERKIKSLPKGDLAHAAGFDDLIAGNDRHSANWGFSGNKLCFIDNGLSLGKFRDIAFIKRSFLREAGRRLDNFINANEIRKTQAYNTAFIRAYQHRDEITKVFETWQLTKEEQDAFWARVASVNRNLKNVLDNPPEPNADIVITPNNGKHHLSSLDKKFDFRRPQAFDKKMGDWIATNKKEIDAIINQHYGAGFLAGMDSDPWKNRLDIIKQDQDLSNMAKKAGFDLSKMTTRGHIQAKPPLADQVQGLAATKKTKFGHQADLRGIRADRKDIDAFIADQKAAIDVNIMKNLGRETSTQSYLDDVDRKNWILRDVTVNQQFRDWLRAKKKAALQIKKGIK